MNIYERCHIYKKKYVNTGMSLLWHVTVKSRVDLASKCQATVGSEGDLSLQYFSIKGKPANWSAAQERGSRNH